MAFWAELKLIKLMEYFEVRGEKMQIQKNCLACGDIINVRLADHKRGWGKFCDKSCSAAFKCGQRPCDVNRKHAKYSPWADICMSIRDDCYGGGEPPKAPSIQSQTGKCIKVKHKLHSPETKKTKCVSCGVRLILETSDYCSECAIGVHSDDQSWDAHKH